MVNDVAVVVTASVVGALGGVRDGLLVGAGGFVLFASPDGAADMIALG